MSLDAVIGRIDQILQLQQQIQGGNATSATSAAGSASAMSTSGTGAGSTSGSSSFASMLASAQGITGAGDATETADADMGLTGSTAGLTNSISSGATDAMGTAISATGLTSTSGLDGTGLTSLTGTTATTTAAGDAPAQVQEMVSQANSLVGLPYVWGGGHDGWGAQSGYDCSGFVSKVLHAGGLLSEPQDTQSLPSQEGIEDGPGQYVTIYDRTDAGISNDHVIIDLDGQFYESGGGHGAWGGGGGVEKIDTPSASYLASFNRILHPVGL